MDASQLKRIPIFEDVSDEELRVVTTFASSEEFPEGKVILREGDYSNHLFAIEEGTVKVKRGDEEIGELGPGDIFGEVGLLEKERRTASIVATSRVRVIKIEHWELQRMKKKLPDVYKRIEDTAAQRQGDS
jgi:CRP/FNR family transcriptional regulator, cyclic AMP receptor protein